MSASKHTPLGDLEMICGEMFDRWDKDQRAGKLLTALGGHMGPGYDPKVDRVRAALASFPELLTTLKALLPTNLNLDHPMVPDSTVVPCDVTLGELRAAASAIARAEGSPTPSPTPDEPGNEEAE